MGIFLSLYDKKCKISLLSDNRCPSHYVGIFLGFYFSLHPVKIVHMYNTFKVNVLWFICIDNTCRELIMGLELGRKTINFFSFLTL